MTRYLFIIIFLLTSSCSLPKAAIAKPSRTTGEASWYDKKSAQSEGTSGIWTASGKRFNENELTCASWDHPFGTKLRVINIKTGKSVVVVVTDRGPNKKLYRRGRIIDLSKASFAKIADLSAGIIKIKIEEI